VVPRAYHLGGHRAGLETLRSGEETGSAAGGVVGASDEVWSC
jgi:hypothetical protein